MTITPKRSHPSRRTTPQKIITAAVLTAVLLGLFASCGIMRPDTESPGAAAPTSQPSDDGVPEVSDPLDIGDLGTDPCGALSLNDLRELDLERKGRQMSQTAGEACAWSYPDVATGEVSFMVYGANKEGLAGIYRQRDTAAQFEPTDVKGYPGVYADAVQGDPAADGRCTLYVGVTKHDVLVLTAQLDGGPDADKPCRIANGLARLTLAHLM